MTSRISRAPATVSREIDGRAVVIHLEDGRVRTLNPTGSVIWTALDGRSVEELLLHLSISFPGEPRERLQNDLETFLSDLMERGLANIDPS